MSWNNIENQINNFLQVISKGLLQDNEIITKKFHDLQIDRDLVRIEVDRLQREIDLIKHTTIEKENLKEIFNDFKSIYAEATPEQQKHLIKILIKKVIIRLGKNDEAGKIEIFFRGDGNIKKEWADKNGNPDQLVFTYYVAWLRKLNSIRTFLTYNKELYTYQYCLKMLAGR